jgi:hypothetical protein
MEIYGQIDRKDEPLQPGTYSQDGYDWRSWSQNLKDSFRSKILLAFLRQPTIANTMVCDGLRDFDGTSRRVDRVVSAYGEELSKKLLREDYIGLPKITNLLPDTICILNGDMEYNRNREIFIQKILKCPQA